MYICILPLFLSSMFGQINSILQRKLPSPGFQVEVVLVDYDGSIPSKPSSPTTTAESGGASATDAAAKEINTEAPKQTNESGSKDRDDVFSDSDSESSKNRRSKATGDVVEPSSSVKESEAKAAQVETSNLAHGIQQVSLKREGDSKASHASVTKTEEKIKASSVMETPEVGSTGMSEFKAIAADASVFSFGDEDDYESE